MVNVVKDAAPKTNAQIALECAALVYSNGGTSAYSGAVTNMADAFLRWLQRNSDTDR